MESTFNSPLLTHVSDRKATFQRASAVAGQIFPKPQELLCMCVCERKRAREREWARGGVDPVWLTCSAGDARFCTAPPCFPLGGQQGDGANPDSASSSLRSAEIIPPFQPPDWLFEAISPEGPHEKSAWNGNVFYWLILWVCAQNEWKNSCYSKPNANYF